MASEGRALRVRDARIGREAGPRQRRDEARADIHGTPPRTSAVRFALARDPEAAEVFGMTILQSLLPRADEVIR